MPRRPDGQPIRCPICEGRLVEVQRSGVLIDACPACRGIWLERGELEKLIALELRLEDEADPDDDFFAEVEGRRRAQPPPEPARQARPDDRGRPEKPRKRKRRAAFDLLEDLLDFD
ncbi:MAG: zf-TFIIB domain-containing protein [Thermoleophilia bacterium]